MMLHAMLTVIVVVVDGVFVVDFDTIFADVDTFFLAFRMFP